MKMKKLSRIVIYRKVTYKFSFWIWTCAFLFDAWWRFVWIQL